MRIRLTPSTEAEMRRQAEMALRERFMAGRAWRLGCPQVAEDRLRVAEDAERGIPEGVLADVFGASGMSALLGIVSLARLGAIGAEILEERSRRPV